MARSPTNPGDPEAKPGPLVPPHREVRVLADYPCDWHKARYLGESTRVFLNLYRGNERAAFRGSLCGDCLADLVADWLERALYRDPRGYWAYPVEGQGLEGLWEARSEPSDNDRRFKAS